MMDHLTHDDCVELMPEWEGEALEIQVLTGGITNRLYRVTLSDGRGYVVRVYGHKTELFIDRWTEMENLRLMARSGVSPGLVRYLPERRVTIVEFVPGRSLSNADFLRRELLPRIVRSIQRVHACGVRLPRTFEPVVELHRLLDLYTGLGVDVPGFDLRGTVARLEHIAAVAGVSSATYLPCHNDLLADNFILVDEPGQRGAEIYLIDWEYAGMSTPYYDLADMLQEILVPREVELELLRLYWGEPELERHVRLTDMFKPMPDIYWTLWSLIQLQVSTIEFDYLDYARTKYANALENIERLGARYGLRIS